MKTRKLPHGTAFEETFTVTLRGEVEGAPLGWGDSSHEKQWLEKTLRKAVSEAVGQYYQVRLVGTSLVVTIP